MSKATELVTLNKDKADDPRYAVCYARGSVFKAEGHFFRVEKGKRTVVLRALCLSQYFGSRCKICPHSRFSVKFVSTGGSDAGSP
jgi:hypothetical protein